MFPSFENQVVEFITGIFPPVLWRVLHELIRYFIITIARMSWLLRNKISQKCTRSPFSLDHLNTMKVTIHSHALALVSPDSMLENSIIIREIPILSAMKKTTSSWNFIQIAPQWACITTTMAMICRARDALRLLKM